jgi:uncharacterized protein (TIGR03086 family)
VIDLKPACERMIEVLAGIADDQLTNPTPCTEYTVGDLVDHVDQVAVGGIALARRTAELPDIGARPDAANLDTRWRHSITQHVRELGEAWDDPAAWQGKGNVPGLEQLSSETWGKVSFTELVVHGWDIAQATGQPFDLPEDLLRSCLDHVVEFVPNAPLPNLWGPPVDVAPDAALLDRIVAITGRTP